MSNGIRSIKEFYNSLSKHGRLLDHRFGITIQKSGFEDIQLFGASASIPMRKVNTTDVKYFGQTFRLPTTLEEEGEWTVSLSADADNNYLNRFRAWQEEYASWQKSGGGFKGISNVNAYVDIYNGDISKIIDQFAIKGIFPSQIERIAFSHDEDGIVVFDVDFAFQLCYNSKRGTDPLY